MAEEAELEENKKRPTLERQDERDETVDGVLESADGCEDVDVEDEQYEHNGHFGESESSKEEPIVRQAPRKRRSIRNLFKSTPLFNKSHSD